MSKISQKDKETLRELGKKYAEIAALPVHEEKKKLWIELNGLHPVRPMVMIDQVCWNEMEINELTPKCEDMECRKYERQIRMKLYQWKHFPVDMVIEPVIKVNRAINDSGWGLKVDDEVAVLDPANAVVGHLYHNLLKNDEDIEKIQMPVISHDTEETERRFSKASEIFDGILELSSFSNVPYLGIWDVITTWMGAQEVLMALFDRPEFMHRVAGKMTKGYLSKLDQLEEKGLLGATQDLIHCTGAYTDELPQEGCNPEKPMTKDRWMFGLAQILGSVSPDMYDEFEITYAKQICERFGLVYYGCCEPLHGKMDQVRKLPNVRKVSMSPWADNQKGAEEIGKDYVFSSKPNPAHVAMDSFNENLVRKELTDIKKACDDNNCALEFILKDLSTVKHEPERLDKWAKIAMEVVES